MEEKTRKEELEEILSKMGVSISEEKGDATVTITLRDETGKQLVEFRESSEESAFERIEKALLAAILRHRMAEIFGDMLDVNGVGILVIK